MGVEQNLQHVKVFGSSEVQHADHLLYQHRVYLAFCGDVTVLNRLPVSVFALLIRERRKKTFKLRFYFWHN